MNEKTITLDNIESLLRNWPQEEFEGLLEENRMNPETNWAKSERYFVDIGEEPRFYQKLKLWKFKIKFLGDVGNVKSQQE